MIFHAIGAVLKGRTTLLAFDGTFSTTSASSPVTSSTRTISGTGTLLFENLGGTVPAGGTYSKNGGAFTTITEGLTLAMTNGDTLAIRLTSALAGNLTFTLKDNLAGDTLEDVVMTRT